MISFALGDPGDLVRRRTGRGACDGAGRDGPAGDAGGGSWRRRDHRAGGRGGWLHRQREHDGAAPAGGRRGRSDPGRGGGRNLRRARARRGSGPGSGWCQPRDSFPRFRGGPDSRGVEEGDPRRRIGGHDESACAQRHQSRCQEPSGSTPCSGRCTRPSWTRGARNGKRLGANAIGCAVTLSRHIRRAGSTETLLTAGQTVGGIREDSAGSRHHASPRRRRRGELLARAPSRALTRGRRPRPRVTGPPGLPAPLWPRFVEYNRATGPRAGPARRPPSLTRRNS